METSLQPGCYGKGRRPNGKEVMTEPNLASRALTFLSKAVDQEFSALSPELAGDRGAEWRGSVPVVPASAERSPSPFSEHPSCPHRPPWDGVAWDGGGSSKTCAKRRAQSFCSQSRGEQMDPPGCKNSCYLPPPAPWTLFRVCGTLASIAPAPPLPLHRIPTT